MEWEKEKNDNLFKFVKQKTKQDENKMMDNLNFVKELGFKSKKYLESGKFNKFAELMNEHWEYKQSRSKQMSNKNK